MKHKQQVLFGIGASVLIWAIFILADLIDEYVLGGGFFIGSINMMILPFVMLFFYMINYLRRKPETKKIIIWFVSYSLMYLILWYVIFYLEDVDKFIIQKHSSNTIDVNGIEYTLYGFSTLLFFIALCVVFHVIYYLYIKIKQSGDDR